MRALVQSLRGIVEESYAQGAEFWPEHVRNVNAAWALDEAAAFQLPHVNAPPAWFNGDVESIEAGRWVLVLSLNPGLPNPHYVRPMGLEEYWGLWRSHNTTHYYPRFFRPLVTLAAAVLGDERPDREHEPQFATQRMVFVELIPYASARFGLGLDVVQELLRSDPGCAFAARVFETLLEAQPRALFINGNSGLEALEFAHGPALKLRRVEYLSQTASAKRLWHKQGTLEHRQGIIPVCGFPFLRNRSTHNSNGEIAQLARMLGEFVATS